MHRKRIDMEVIVAVVDAGLVDGLIAMGMLKYISDLFWLYSECLR